MGIEIGGCDEIEDVRITDGNYRVCSGAFEPGICRYVAVEFSKCVTKFARSTQGATVTLECVAANGKVSDCKVLDGPVPRNGFDHAALCVADYLPVGSKTGTINFPIKFEPGHN